MKKISEDKNSATFRHKDGHEIKIAISSLSPELKKQLSKIPVCETKEKKMAFGGDPGPTEIPSDDEALKEEPNNPQFAPDNPANMAMESVDPRARVVPAGLPPQQGPAVPSPISLDQPAPAPAQTEATPSDESQQSPPSVGKAIVSKQKAPETAAALNSEYNLLKDDYLKNKITPKLFADVAGKGVLSKIGTLFGLMVSGAGAGLSHQPNLLLELMNKEIDRDLESQKGNQQNRLQMINAINQHHLAEAEFNLKGLQGQEAAANTGLIQANTRLANQNVLKTNALLEALGFLNKNGDKLPPGPRKDQYQQGLQGVSNAIDQHVGQMNQQTAQKIENNWQQGNEALNYLSPEMSKYQAERHVPYNQNKASLAIPQSDRDKMESQQILDNKVKDLLDFSVQHRGSLAPDTRARAAQKAEELISYYNNSLDKHGLGEGRLDWLSEQIKKNPTDIIPQVLGNNERMREIRDSNAYRMGVLQKKYGLSENGGEAKGAAPIKIKIGNRIGLYDPVTQEPIGWEK